MLCWGSHVCHDFPTVKDIREDTVSSLIIVTDLFNERIKSYWLEFLS